MRLLTKLLFSIIVMTPFAAAAQREYSPNFMIGASAGATLSEMSISPHIDQTWLPGMTVGVRARYTEEKLFGIIVELNVTQRGWKEKYEPGEDFSYKCALTYLQLPFLTHIYFGSDRIRGFVNLGPEVGVMISSKISANFDYTNIKTVAGYPQGYRTNEQLNMEISNRFDYGIAGGIGAEYFVNRRNSVMLEGRFYYGLGNIFPAAKRDYFSASRSMSIEITAAWMFRLR